LWLSAISKSSTTHVVLPVVVDDRHRVRDGQLALLREEGQLAAAEGVRDTQKLQDDGRRDDVVGGHLARYEGGA
jgi:hypothetical protein